MKLSVIDTGYFKLDGGAMFGVVPKSLWSKLETPDEQNLCTWAMRCLLIETEGRKIIIDTGIGNKQSEKFFSHFHPHGDATLISSLAKNGLTVNDITDVFLTHLHFDHVGGAILQDSSGKSLPTFPNATYWSNQAHYDWAFTPNAREKASFLKENFVPLMEEGILKMVDALPYDQILDWLPNVGIGYAYGHTEALMTPRIQYQGKTIIYCADLLPSPSHISMPYVMGYDVRPLQTLIEKEWFLTKAVNEGHILFFEHAPTIEACTVKRNEKGRIVADKMGKLSDFVQL
ncbi:MBL fold metallo-hydrolase [Aureispira anguillae]|uniref:MBL fold metallo-hydrolase n=1 Tax=Aureispira anguillae TaxID=2864201 RepID=A0A915YFM7_9BACT|nr:MBL fold metallo-hydrolase [Aureispira anguillae]BDS12108.1 MBL fold metallo-hydrolase [Aureispira anguillae]